MELEEIKRKWVQSNEDNIVRVYSFATPYPREKLRPLLGQRVFHGSGIATMLWKGNKGDFNLSETPVYIPREDYASVSIITRGSFRVTESPEGSGPWPLITPGMVCGDVSPGFPPGRYKWEAMEDYSVDLCSGGVSSSGHTDQGQFIYKAVDEGSFLVPKESVLIVATGSVDVDDMRQESPTFIHAIKTDIRVMMRGKGVWIARV